MLSSPGEKNGSLKQDGGHGGGDEWMNSINIWEMESTGLDDLVADAIPREIHF